MKSLYTAIVCAFMLLACSSQASSTNSVIRTVVNRVEISTNAYYVAGSFDYELAPTITSPTFLATKDYEIGISFEAEYWQSPSTGTGIELGSYNYKMVIDHFSVMEDYRFTPFISPFGQRFAVTLKIGTEHINQSNVQTFDYGLGVDFAFSKRFKWETDLIEHYSSSAADNGVTLRTGLQLSF